MNTSVIDEMNRILELQKQLNTKEGAPSIQLRLDRLDRCSSMVMNYKKQIIEAWAR